jgi:nucleoside-diphosphate-sugar epimerase
VRLRCRDLAEVAPVPELADANVVINAAGPRVHAGLKWADYLREHVGTATRVAISARPGSHVVLVSSASVYGAGRGHVTPSTAPQPDSYPVSPYAWAKLASEYATRAVCAERGVSLTVLRPSMIYGPGAGGALLRLRDIARRRVRFVLAPEGARQHLLHIDLFRLVLQALAARPAPERVATYMVADPFVLTAADINLLLRAAAPRAASVPLPVGLAAGAVRAWQSRSERQPPGAIAVAAMLMVDNVYDWQPCLDHLCIDPGPFGRERFDEFFRSG